MDEFEVEAASVDILPDSAKPKDWDDMSVEQRFDFIVGYMREQSD